MASLTSHGGASDVRLADLVGGYGGLLALVSCIVMDGMGVLAHGVVAPVSRHRRHQVVRQPHGGTGNGSPGGITTRLGITDGGDRCHVTSPKGVSPADFRGEGHRVISKRARTIASISRILGLVSLRGRSLVFRNWVGVVISYRGIAGSGVGGVFYHGRVRGVMRHQGVIAG